MKKIYRLFSLILGLVLSSAFFIGCNTSSTTASADELSYISMRINPEIELVVDRDGKVVAVNAINEDGEIVLCELSLIGMTAEEAGQAFTAMATELGFIDLDTNEATVFILAKGENPDFVKDLEDKLEKNINNYFDKNGIFGKVSPEDLTEFEALATEWNVSLDDARMISRALELYPEMTVEEILALDFKDIVKLIKDDSAKNDLPVKLRDQFKNDLDVLNQKYSRLFDLKKELKDLEIMLENEQLSQDELALIQAEYDEKKAEFEALNAQYTDEVANLKSNIKKDAETVRNETKNKAQTRRAQHVTKLQEHKDKFNSDKENILDQISQWRENR